MTTKIPVKAIYSGPNVTALGEFVSGDTISTTYTDAKITSVANQTGAISNIQLAAAVNQTGIFTTANVAENTNLYYTNARVYSNVLELNYATVSYVDGAIANVIDSAPGVLDTLNEIAAAISDDPNFFANVAASSGVVFDKANTLVATVAGVSSTLISNTNLLDGIKTVDGSSSGLDSDLLDGQDGLYYLNWNNTTNKPDPVITVTLSGDVTGSASTTLADVTSNTITISTTIAANSVELGVDTTGNYVAGISGTTNRIIVAGSGSEGATPNIDLASSGVTPATYGNATTIPIITVDTYGRITAASNVVVAGVSSFSASANTFTIATADGGSFSASIQENSVRLGTDTTGAYLANLIAGTGVTISGLGNESTTPTVSIGQAVGVNDDVSFANTTVRSLTVGNIQSTGYQFPIVDGSALQILQTDGNGQLSFVNLDTATGGGYSNSTLIEFPGTDGNIDYGAEELYAGENATGLSDAFGVSLGAVYDCMEPTGRMVNEDFSVLT